jgi:hypothetical protein
VSVPHVYVVNSHRWLYRHLTSSADAQAEFVLVNDKTVADIIIYIDPPWPDVEAPEHLRTLSARDTLRLYLFSQNDDPCAWAPGVFASLPRSCAYRSAFAGGFFVPHHHHEAGGFGEYLEPTTLAHCDILWSFVGTVENASVRTTIAALDDERGFVQDTKRWSETVRWRWQSDHAGEGQEAFRSYASALQRSKFVVCPRGRGPSSIRLFEALQVGRCPVIVSDEWLAPPFVDWEGCSIKVSESRVHELPALLREREGDADALGRAARRAWERHYAPERRLATLVQSCVAISRALPARHRIAVALHGCTRPYVLRRFARQLTARVRRVMAKAEVPRT